MGGLWRTVMALGIAAWLLMPAAASARSGQTATPSDFGTLQVCEDDNEWPPYNYYRRDKGQKTDEVTGFSVDVIKEIAQHHGFQVKFELIPWRRCLTLAAIGKAYQMSTNMTPSPERERSFLLSRPYYTTTSYYYYSRRHHPNGLTVKAMSDLHSYRVCGIQGFNYSYYGLGPNDVDQGTRTFDATIAKLHLNRCDLFVEKLEVMMGYAALGRDYLADPELGKAPLPGAASTSFHIAVSRQYPRARELMELVDAELAHMEETGRLQALWARYVRHQ